jgi:carboxymethylenebutenolidase
MGEMVDIKAEDISVTGYMALPASGSGPGILLMHAWWGLNGFFKSLADRLAKEGFTVLAPDLYDGKTASEVDGAQELINSLDSRYKEAIKQEEAALDYLLKHPALDGDKVAAIGFSMGAGYAGWLAALRPEIVAVVMFYGGSEVGFYVGGAQEYANQTEAAFLGHFAEGDEWEPDEGVKQFEAQLRAAGREANFHFYRNAGHWFFEDDRPDVYNPEAAQLAWNRTVSFFHDKLA